MLHKWNHFPDLKERLLWLKNGLIDTSKIERRFALKLLCSILGWLPSIPQFGTLVHCLVTILECIGVQLANWVFQTLILTAWSFICLSWIEASCVPDFPLVFADLSAVQELEWLMIFLNKYWIVNYLRKFSYCANPGEMAIHASNYGYLDRVYCAKEALSLLQLGVKQMSEGERTLGRRIRLAVRW